MIVRELMSDPYYIDNNASLKEVAKIMSSKRIGGLIYMPKGKIEGIVTEADLIKNFNKKGNIKEVMSENVITINAEKDISEAFRLMRENEIKRLPVLDENEKLVGIITITDLAAHADELEEDFFFD